MANIKIAQLTNATTITDTDIVLIEDATQTKKMTVANLKSLLGIQGGGIIESGFNANGGYTKFLDGTMICTKSSIESGVAVNQAYGNAFIGFIGWTFPIPFVGSPCLNISAKKSGIVTLTALNSNGTSSCSFYLIDLLTGQGAAGDTELNLMAIGRWKA